ncbi:MAG: hypothetical protein KJO07_00265 [Deltaproteobacteria bacterium]|nr:hypothetical protein [Deltaproteobacteria bacterium]
MKLKKTLASALFASLAATGCASDGVSTDGFQKKGDPRKGDASAEATFVNMEFDGEVVTDFSFDAKSTVEDQMLYTIGHLNGDRSVGRLDQLQLTAVETEQTPDGKTKISYHAVLPVAWGDKDSFPSSYTFQLPADISFAGQQAFTDSYKDDCVDFSAHDVDSGSMWYYYRPDRFNCELATEDIVTIEATLTLSDTNTSGKYPEYDKVWEDDELRVVAVFGKYEDDATSSSDAGIRAYNTFLSSIKGELSGSDLVTTPASVPSSPGVDVPEVRFEATLADGRTVTVDALLVDNVRTAPAEFNDRYAELSGTADLIIYNGHAGLGANIRALAQKGDWLPGQYKMVFMNGCDTYAYVDGAIVEAHAAINPDDPEGTRYVDMITNALPSFFASMSGATMALVRGLLDTENPQTYEQMFENIDSSQVVLVSGEHDNTFVPGGGGTPVDSWDGLELAGTVLKTSSGAQEDRFETPVLPAGSYEFVITGNGDADLYVKVGAEPTDERFDCRPFLNGSQERCVVELGAPAQIFGMVRAWDPESDYQLSAGAL